MYTCVCKWAFKFDFLATKLFSDSFVVQLSAILIREIQFQGDCERIGLYFGN